MIEILTVVCVILFCSLITEGVLLSFLLKKYYDSRMEIIEKDLKIEQLTDLLLSSGVTNKKRRPRPGHIEEDDDDDNYNQKSGSFVV